MALVPAIQDAINPYRDRAKKTQWSKEVARLFEKDEKSWKRISPNLPEYIVQSNYLDTIVSLPWGEYTARDAST